MATTINAYSVGLGLDASEYIRNSKLSRKETAQLKREINSARTPAEDYERRVSLLEKALSEGAIEQNTYNRLLDEAENKLHRASKATERLDNTQKGMNSTLDGAKLAWTALGAVGAFELLNRLSGALTDAARAAAQFTAEGVLLAGQMQSTELQFKNLIGSAEEAAVTMDKLRGFSAKTPFAFDDLSKASQLLMNSGTAVDDLERQLRVLGNVSAGTGARLNDMASILARVRNQQRFGLEEINQLTDRNIQAFDLLSQRLGVTADQVRDFASKGLLNASDLEAVLNHLGEAGGKFSTGLLEQSQTLDGMLSTYRDNWKLLQIEVGETFLPTMNQLVSTTTQLVTIANQFHSSLTSSGVAAGAISSSVDKMILGFAQASDFAFQMADWLGAFENNHGLENLYKMARDAAKQEATEQQDRLAEADKLREAAQKEIEQRRIAADSQQKAADLERQLEQLQKAQVGIQDKLAQGRMRYAQQMEQIIKQEKAAVAAKRQGMIDAVAKGPGSFSEGDEVAFLARQENARIAKEATLNFEKENGFDPGVSTSAADQTLQRIEEMNKEAERNRKELLRVTKKIQENQPVIKRIR